MCGGAVIADEKTCYVMGRSPRVRGSRPTHGRPPVRGGSIPACAGEPVEADIITEVKTVDPRVCGGALLEAGEAEIAEGRSPRVRGSRTPSTH